MIFSGLQKLTLLDYPGRMACTLFTGGCNFRCPFCHNASLVLAPAEGERLTEEQVFAFLQKRRGVLDGVCITGGEPLLWPDLADVMRRMKAMGYAVKLDTNGSFPDRLAALLEEKLPDYVAMDLKNSPASYGKTIGVADYDIAPVERSVRLLLAGKVEYEFRTTLVKGLHTRQDAAEMARWIAGAKCYYLQQFVDSGDLIGSGLEGFSREEMQQFLIQVREVVPAAELRGV